ELLSFSISSRQVSPTQKAQRKAIQDVKETIQDAKRDIFRTRRDPRRAQPRFVQSMALIDTKVRGWGDAFSVSSDGLAFSRLDREIDDLIAKYREWFYRTVKDWTPIEIRRAYGVALLSDMRIQST